MSKFWEMLEQSAIMQGVITVLMLGIYGYLIVTGAEVPATLEAAVTLVLGFFFGAKTGAAVAKYSVLKGK